MSGTTEQMRLKIERTKDMGSVVHTMKALAASKIGQYEESVKALEEYYRTLALGLSVCLKGYSKEAFPRYIPRMQHLAGAIVFGSDQSLVGQFNDVLSSYLMRTFQDFSGKLSIWVIGERMHSRLIEVDLPVVKLYSVPSAVKAITPLIGRILIDSQMSPLYVFHNRPLKGATYEQTHQRLLPLDESWIREMTRPSWITDQLPEVMGNHTQTLRALVREYLFVSLFKACAESLAAENASRLAAMQRAEKNIDEMLGELQHSYHQLRQNSIDEELFDIISGFEALQGG